MSQVVRLPRSGSLFACVDSSFGTPDATTGNWFQLYPTADTLVQLVQPGVERNDMRRTVYDQLAAVPGIKGGAFTIPLTFRPRKVAMTSAVVAPAQSSLGKILGAAFGASIACNPGPTLTSNNDTTLTCSGGTESRVTVGGVLILITGTGAAYPVRVTNKSSATITFEPQLNGDTVSSVVTAETWYLNESIGQSVTFRHFIQNQTDAIFQGTSCVLNPEFKFERGALAAVDVKAESATWAHNDNSSPVLTVAFAADDLSAPLVENEAVTMLAYGGAMQHGNGYSLSVRKLGLQIDFGNKFLEELGGVQGKTGVARIPGRRAATLTIETVYDPDGMAIFGDGNDFQFMHYVKSASGSRVAGFYVPSMQLTKQPEIASDGDLLVAKYEFGTTINDTMAAATGATASPLVMFAG